MVSANSSSKQILAGLEAGANDYITKPFHRDELQARLHAAIRHTQLLDGELRLRAPVAARAAMLALPPSVLVRCAAGPGCGSGACACDIFCIGTFCFVSVSIKENSEKDVS